MRWAVVMGWAGLALFSAASAAKTDEALLPSTHEIEQAVRTAWSLGGNRQALCASIPVFRADQQGIQELQQVFAPGQWAVRVAQLPQHRAEIAQLDHLAKFGLLERREAFLNFGPIQGLPALEYRVTTLGWTRSMSEGEAMYPCFYFGTAQILKVLGYTEAPGNEAGFTHVTAHFLVGTDRMEPWAGTREAAELFPAVKQNLEGRKVRFTFARDADGRPRGSRNEQRRTDETKPPAAELPGVAVAYEAIQSTRALADPRLSFPAPCLPLLSKHMVQLWKEGDAGAAEQAILHFPGGGGSARSIAALAHSRLSRLQRAGLVALRGDARSGQLVVVPSPMIQPLLVQHGNCLPLGKVRVEVDGVLPNRFLGEGQRFKARYIVEEPEPWIKAVKAPALLADLDAILRHGQPFEGSTARTADGWRASSLVDRRPMPALASLSAIGVSSDWTNVSEATIAGAAVVDHEVHIVDAYGAPAQASAQSPAHAMGRIDVLVKRRPRPVLLVLTGYEPIEWHLTVEKGARVDAVLAVGYHEQRITGLPANSAAVSAYSRDGMLRPDPAMTHLGRLPSTALPSKLGVEPASVKKGDAGKVVVDGKREASDGR